MAEPVVPDSHDLIIREDGEYKHVQVKTCRVRPERNNAIVVNGMKDSGEVYTPEDCDYILGVMEDRAFMFPCVGYREYWATPDNADVKWTELPITMSPSEDGKEAC